MNTNLKSWLLGTGLDEQRAEIYLLCLSRGEAMASELAEDAKIGRTAIYDNLRVLEERGFVQMVQRGKRKVFVPLHPKELYKRIEHQKDQLKDLLPDFLGLYAGTTGHPSVQMFEGPYAAREVLEDILQVTQKEYLYLSPARETIQTVDVGYAKKWVERRVKKGIMSRALRVKSKMVDGEPVFNAQEGYLRQIRYLPTYVDLKSTIYIYENNIGVISTKKEGRAFIIHSPDLAYTFRQVCEFLWSVSMKD